MNEVTYVKYDAIRMGQLFMCRNGIRPEIWIKLDDAQIGCIIGSSGVRSGRAINLKFSNPEAFLGPEGFLKETEFVLVDADYFVGDACVHRTFNETPKSN